MTEKGNQWYCRYSNHYGHCLMKHWTFRHYLKNCHLLPQQLFSHFLLLTHTNKTEIRIHIAFPWFSHVCLQAARRSEHSRHKKVRFKLCLSSEVRSCYDSSNHWPRVHCLSKLFVLTKFDTKTNKICSTASERNTYSVGNRTKSLCSRVILLWKQVRCFLSHLIALFKHLS
jgi:hypothetical protein